MFVCFANCFLLIKVMVKIKLMDLVKNKPIEPVKSYGTKI